VIFATILVAAVAASPTGLRKRVAAVYENLRTESIRFSVDTSHLSESVKGPDWADDWRVEREGGRRPGGTEAITVVWKAKDGSRDRRDWIQVRVEREELVPLAKRRLARGDRVDSSNVEWQWRRTTGVRATPVSLDSMDRFRLRTGVAAGQVVWREQFEILPVVRRGDMVKVRAGYQGASASVEAQALQDGAPGDRIRLKSPFGRTITGTTGSDGTVTVH